MDAIKTWFLALSPQQKTKLALVAAALVVVGYWFVNQPGEQTAIEEPQESSLKVTGTLFVHVVGEVAEPGLYQLPLGARIQDAIAAAGGFTAEALAHSVNLARNLSDGEQVVVLSHSEEGELEQNAKLSINRSTAQQLEALPGVGPALAKRIVDYRKSVGSFSDIRQLREVSGIGERLFAQISELVTL
jgi:competence protein ComEA